MSLVRLNLGKIALLAYLIHVYLVLMASFWQANACPALKVITPEPASVHGVLPSAVCALMRRSAWHAGIVFTCSKTTAYQRVR